MVHLYFLVILSSLTQKKDISAHIQVYYLIFQAHHYSVLWKSPVDELAKNLHCLQLLSLFFLDISVWGSLVSFLGKLVKYPGLFWTDILLNLMCTYLNYKDIWLIST